MDKQKLSYTVAETVTAVGLGRSRLYQEIREGRLRVVKAGRRTLILSQDLQKWLDALPAATQGSLNDRHLRENMIDAARSR
jgi:excisionase family DNA binding protein